MKFRHFSLAAIILFVISCTKSNPDAIVHQPAVYVGGLTGILGLFTQGIIWSGSIAVEQ
jgi:hypothetical protein